MKGLFHQLWLREKADNAETRRLLAATEAALDTAREVLAVTEIERDALRRHFALAVSQRDGARALAAAIVSEREWSDEDWDFLAEHGMEGPA